MFADIRRKRVKNYLERIKKQIKNYSEEYFDK